MARCLVFVTAVLFAALAQADTTSQGRRLLQEVQAVEPLPAPVAVPVQPGVAAAGPEQLIITPAPVVPSTCHSFTDAGLRASQGSVLCTSQAVTLNTTKIVCNEWKPECRQVVSETRLVDPAAPGADAGAYATTATAACQMLGYSSFGSGTMHATGAAKELCHNGKGFSTDNWWTVLVCCK